MGILVGPGSPAALGIMPEGLAKAEITHTKSGWSLFYFALHVP